MLNRSTYTFSSLKEGIYKALSEYTLNGERISDSSGTAADIEKRLIHTLNQCLRRVALSMPLCEKRTELVFTCDSRGVHAVLPEDFGRVVSLRIGNDEIAAEGMTAVGNELYADTAALGASMNGTLLYTVFPGCFNDETPADALVELPDVTADALIYLTAAELCPADYGELYARLMYKYRDLALNAYNAERSGGGRNRFFAIGGRKRRSLLFGRRF